MPAVRSRHQVHKRASKDARTAPDGKVFDSIAEMRRWFQLKEMQDRGLIRDLRRQVTTEILIYGSDGKQILSLLTLTGRTAKYTVDFLYEELQNTSHGSREWTDVYEEYKGVDDPTSQQRRAVFELSMKQYRGKPYDFKVRVTGPAKNPKSKKKPAAPTAITAARSTEAVE